MECVHECVYYNYIITKEYNCGVQMPTNWLLSPPDTWSQPGAPRKMMYAQLKMQILRFSKRVTVTVIQLHHFHSQIHNLSLVIL